MVLGSYYLTLDKDGEKGEGKVFRDFDEALMAYDAKAISLHAKIKVRRTLELGEETISKLIETTVGRIIFNQPISSGSGVCGPFPIRSTCFDLEIDFLVGKKAAGQDH